jgi:hypothetical protein
MVVRMAKSWQSRRNQFSHDWLKNRYNPALVNYLRLLEGLVEDVEFEEEFLSKHFPEWEMMRLEAQDLVNTFPQEMSPLALFHVLPLIRCDDETKEWLGSMLHSLWATKYAVEDLMDKASQAILQVDICYYELKRALPDSSNNSTEALRLLYEKFSELYSCCQQLGNMFSRFPREVKAV